MPPDAARVVAIFTAPGAGAPVERHARATLLPGVGIAGDRYAAGRGHWSAPRWPDQQLTLVEQELATELGLEPGALRRNLVTSGVALHDLVGVRFRIGEALLAGMRPCTPCRYIEGFTRPGLLRALGARGGLRAAVLAGGTVREGDAIEVLGPVEPQPALDPGDPGDLGAR